MDIVLNLKYLCFKDHFLYFILDRFLAPDLAGQKLILVKALRQVTDKLTVWNVVVTIAILVVLENLVNVLKNAKTEIVAEANPLVCSANDRLLQVGQHEFHLVLHFHVFVD